MRQFTYIFLLLLFLFALVDAHNDTDTNRPRSHIISTAPEVVLIIGGSTMLVLACAALLMLILCRSRLDGVKLYLLMWCIIIIAFYASGVAYLLVARNQFVVIRDDKTAIAAPLFALNYVLWMLVMFAAARFLRLHQTIQVIVMTLAGIGLFVQGLASFSSDPLQWGLYFIGLMPLLPIPWVLYVKQERDTQRLWSETHTIVCVFAIACLKIMYMITDLAGHSFGGKYQGLGASDEIALQMIQHALTYILFIYMSVKVLPPKILNFSQGLLDEHNKQSPD